MYGHSTVILFEMALKSLDFVQELNLVSSTEQNHWSIPNKFALRFKKKWGDIVFIQLW